MSESRSGWEVERQGEDRWLDGERGAGGVGSHRESLPEGAEEGGSDALEEWMDVSEREEQYVDYIRKNLDKFSVNSLGRIMENPVGFEELKRQIAKMNSQQIQVVCRHLDDRGLMETIPRLQLQQQEVAVQVFSGHQIRVYARSVSPSDRSLMQQNIEWLRSCEGGAERDQEVQGIISFLDPLAMVVASEREELVERLVKNASVMTPPQVRVLVPLLEARWLREMLERLDGEESQALAKAMVQSDQLSGLVELYAGEVGGAEEEVGEMEREVGELGEGVKELRQRAESFCTKAQYLQVDEREYRVLMGQNTGIRSGVGELQRRVRTKMAMARCAVEVCKMAKEEEVRERYRSLCERLELQAGRIHGLRAELENEEAEGRAIRRVTMTWMERGKSQAVEPEKSKEIDLTEDDSVYADLDKSMALYEAVRAIGNPEAVGETYSFNWMDIVSCGIRNLEDMQRHGIGSLSELEEFIRAKAAPRGEVS